MKKIVICGIFLAFSGSASAQTLTPPRWSEYVFFAPGASNSSFGEDRATVHVGGGGEALIHKGLNIGAEVGPIIGAGFTNVHGLGSANIGYHFLHDATDRKFEPFLTAGYSLFFANLSVPGRGRTGTQSGYNAGGGVNLWLDRLEVRGQSSKWYKTMDVRLGVTFR